MTLDIGKPMHTRDYVHANVAQKNTSKLYQD